MDEKDRFGNIVKSGFLVSPDGQRILIEDPNFIDSSIAAGSALVEAAGKKYFVKMETEGSPSLKDEMLRMQSLSLDLKDKLEHLKIRLPVFLFASDTRAGTMAEDNDTNYEAIDERRIEDLKTAVSEYILNERLKGNTLWEKVNINIPNNPTDRNTTIINNFKKKQDGTAVWTDPFVYEKQS